MSTFMRLLKLVAPFKWWIALAVLLSFLAVGSSVGLMAMSAYLISKAALVTDVVDVALAITMVRVLAISRAVFRYLERYYSHTATLRILAHLRVWFYESVEPLAPARLMRYRSGDLLARITGDIETLQNFYVRVVVPPVAAVLVTALTCAILGSFDASLAAATLGFLVLTGVALPLVSRWISKQPAIELVATRAELNAMLVDEIQGIADLLSFDQAADHQGRVLALSGRLSHAQERMAMMRGASNALAALFTSLAGLTVLGLAIPLVSSGRIEGVYLALLPLAAIASFEAVQPLSLALQQLSANQAAARRLFELIDAPPAVTDPAHVSPSKFPVSRQPHDYGIEVRNLRFRYAPDEPLVLDSISFSAPAGGRVAIVGPSGSGKSTIVNLLLRFWDYGEGEIRVGGCEVRAYPADDVRALFGVVPQRIHLFGATLRDNLLLANPDATDELVIAACRQAQLEDFVRSLPDGYDTLIGENGLSLSGGERQRLAIARAILRNAPILILDEATANLDAVTEQQVVQALELFMRNRTTLIISHHPVRWGHVDQVIRLDMGKPVVYC
jgi:ATP-binding cassette subfamily C protein CydC